MLEVQLIAVMLIIFLQTLLRAVNMYTKFQLSSFSFTKAWSIETKKEGGSRNDLDPRIIHFRLRPIQLGPHAQNHKERVISTTSLQFSPWGKISRQAHSKWDVYNINGSLLLMPWQAITLLPAAVQPWPFLIFLSISLHQWGPTHYQTIEISNLLHSCFMKV